MCVCVYIYTYIHVIYIYTHMYIYIYIRMLYIYNQTYLYTYINHSHTLHFQALLILYLEICTLIPASPPPPGHTLSCPVSMSPTFCLDSTYN